jgi:hypothetical protein
VVTNVFGDAFETFEAGAAAAKVCAAGLGVVSAIDGAVAACCVAATLFWLFWFFC